MGAGKTAVGRRLAARAGLAFKDTDAEVRKAEGAGPAWIMKTRGLKAFRRIEESVLRKVAKGSRQVVALGGGVTLSKKRGFLRRAGVTIYLSCDEKTLRRRLSRAASARPLLGTDPEKQAAAIHLLLKRRRPYYRRADTTLDVSALSPTRAAARIERLARKHHRGPF
jgi:shikimate kinase